jgi:hypothetical protein
MRFPKLAVCALGLALSFGSARSQTQDLADSALLSAFQRDNAKLLCLSKAGSLKETRELLNPYIKDIDVTDEASYSALAIAVYTAFPCPFSPSRRELRAATRGDVVGTWLVPAPSGKLRHGPKSRAWAPTPGMAPIKCEGVSYHESGEYRVMHVRGDFACPDAGRMQSMRSMPRVSSWTVLPNGRVKITRTDFPAHFEEWEIYAVRSAFEYLDVKFAAGDLVAYLRREPGNDINAVTTFRHLQPLK